MRRGARWRVLLTAAAEDDFREIVAWTDARFGPRQARVYATTLTHAIRALVAGPNPAGARRRDDIVSGVATLHVARNRRRGSHFVVFRAREDARAIEVLRILHESSDLARHVTPADERE